MSSLRRPVYFSHSRGLGRLRSLWWDLKTFYTRGRYGWAPRDVWSLDWYLNAVLAGALEHLAQNKHGSPVGYPSRTPQVGPDWDVETDHAQWKQDLLRWAKAFHEMDDDDIYEGGSPFDTFEKRHAEEERRRANLQQALQEMTPWWESLWD